MKRVTRALHLPITGDGYREQHKMFELGYVWQHGDHRRPRDLTGNKSLAVFLKEGILARGCEPPETSLTEIPEFTGERWWDKIKIKD